MSFSYKDLKNDRQWKATTGVSEKDFTFLCNAFVKAYEMKHEVSLALATTNLAQEFALSSYEDCLFFVLFQLKNGLTQDCLGPVFNMDGSTAWRNFQKHLQVLELALKQEHALPKRHFQSVGELVKYLHGEKEITLGCNRVCYRTPYGQGKAETIL